MLFSIIIPVYNAENYIRNCLISVLLQSFTDFEVVIINDGSTDSTLRILEEFEDFDCRIKVYNFPNGGITEARKRGVRLAKGKYVIFVDSDDTINDDLLLNLSNTIRKFPNVEVIRFKAIRENDKPGLDIELHNSGKRFDELITGIEAIKDWHNPAKRYELFWLYALKKTKAEMIFSSPNFTTSGDYAMVPIIIASSKYVVMIDYIGYYYTCDNVVSLTHLPGEEKIKKRTRNFILAAKFVTENMKKIVNDTGEDFSFFYEDWKKRLLKRYYLLDKKLQEELKPEFEQVLQMKV